jgi:hypothetical protein
VILSAFILKKVVPETEELGLDAMEEAVAED